MPTPVLQQPSWGRVFVGTQVINLLVTLMLFVMSGELWINLVHSFVIGNIISLLINSSRLVLARWLLSHSRAPSPELTQGWLGWRLGGPLVVVCGVVGYQLGMLTTGLLTGRPVTVPWTHSWHAWGGPAIISVFASLIITWFFYSRAKLSAIETHAAQVAQVAAETQLKLLESQLEPHMLFNTLANLRALIGVDPERAQQMLDRLIDYLRAMLSASQRPWHPLSAEFQRVEDYLALMQIRMGPRLRPHLSLPDALTALPVPPLLLQPLVENAIKHGLEPQRGGGELWVSAEQQGDTVLLWVRDSGRGLPPPTDSPSPANTGQSHGGGFGTQQVVNRLQTVYGDHAEFLLRPREGGGTQACIRLSLNPSPSPRPTCPPP